MSEDAAHQQNHQAGRGRLSQPGMWGVNGGLLQLGRSLVPHKAPVSFFTRPSFPFHHHRLDEQPALLGRQGRKLFSSILARLAGSSLNPDSGRMQRGQPGKAGSGCCEPPPLCPSRVGCGLWPGARWGGCGAPAPAPTLLCVQPAEARGCREEAAPASAAPASAAPPPPLPPHLCCPLASAAHSLPSPQPPGLP